MTNTMNILLRCPACPAEKQVPRLSIDHPEAVAVEAYCDAHGSVANESPDPKYFDAVGNQLTHELNDVWATCDHMTRVPRGLQDRECCDD